MNSKRALFFVVSLVGIALVVQQFPFKAAEAGSGTNTTLDFAAASEANWTEQVSSVTSFTGGNVHLTSTGSTVGGTANANHNVSGSLYSTVWENFVVPVTGTITAWSVNSLNATTLKLKVYQINGANNYTNTGNSASTQVSAGDNSFSTSIPVVAGQVIGLYGANNPFRDAGGTGTLRWTSGDFLGTGGFTNGPVGGYWIPNVSITVSGTPAGTSYYVATTSTNHLSTSTWQTISSVSLTQSTPASTTLKYLVSFDNRTSWKYWNGSSWVTSSLGGIDSASMSQSTIQSMSSANWAASGGFVAGTTATMDWAVALRTDDAAQTPSLDQITINFTTPVADLSLTNVANTSTPNVSGTVTFTLTLTNSGPQSATGVSVKDLLPSGLTYSSAAPSQGSYSSGTGIWTVGTVASGASPTMNLTATAASGTAETSIVNTAQVSASSAEDPDSTPNNSSVGEDDQASVTVVPKSSDLSLLQTVDNPTPDVGTNVTYTLTLRNAGPSANTGVQVKDLLPAGLTFVSNTASVGSYVSGTGIWTVGSMAVNATQTLTITATVASGTGAKTNTAQVTVAGVTDPDSTVNNSVSSEDDQQSTTINIPGADLTLTNSVDNASPTLGDSVVYTVIVTNFGPSTAQGVAVKDILPAGVTYVSSSATQGSYNNSTGIWTIGSITSGFARNLTINVTVNAGTGGSTITNTAQVSAATTGDPDSTPNNNAAGEDDQASSVITVTAADLSLTNTVNNAFPGISGQVMYTITLTNGGPSSTAVTVNDLLPSGLTFVSATPSAGVYDSGSGNWTVGTVAGSTSKTLTLVASVNAGTGGNAIVNTVEVTSSGVADPDSTPNNNNASEDDQKSVTVTPQSADLSLDISASDGSPLIGDSVTYTLTLTNAGPTSTNGVTVAESLPSGMTFVSATPSQGTYSAGVWTVGTVTSGSILTLAITGTVNAGTGAQTLTNTTQVTATTATDPDSTPNNSNAAEDDQSSVSILVRGTSDLVIDNVVSDPNPSIGDSITYFLSIENDGPDSATHVTAKDLLPAGLTFVSATASQGSYVSGTGIWTVGTITNITNATLAITATVNTGTANAAINDTAEVTASDQFDPDSTPNNHNAAEDDQSTASLTVTSSVADLSLTNTVSNGFPSVGNSIAYTVTLTNSGPTQATRVSVKDQLPLGVTFSSASASQGSYVNGTGIWTVGTVASGASKTLTINVMVASGTTGSTITDTAQVTASDQPDPDSTPNNSNAAEDDQASAALTVGAVDLSVTKSVDNATPLIHDAVTFTVTVSNAGPVAATNVRLNDVVPGGLSITSDSASQGTYFHNGGNNNGDWVVGTIASGSSATLTIHTTVNARTGGQTITNTAQVKSVDQGDSDSTPNNSNAAEDDQASASITVIGTSDLSLTAAVDDATPRVGQGIVFTITLHNGGPQTATGVRANDVLPGTLSITSASASQGTYFHAGGTDNGDWAVGSIASGATATLTINATPNAGTGGTTISHTAQVTDEEQTDPDSTPNNDNASEDDQQTVSIDVVAEAADLSLSASADDATPAEGDEIVYTVTVTNGGPSDTAGVVVKDLLPAGLTFVSASPSQGAYASGTGLWTVGAIANGASKTLTITASVDDGTAETIINDVAEVTASTIADPDSTVNNHNAAEDDQDISSVTVGPATAHVDQAPTTFNHVRLSRTKQGVTARLGIDYTLESALTGPLILSVPTEFTITGAFTSGTCSGGGTIDTFAFNEQESVLTAVKHNCSGKVTLNGATVINPEPGTYSFTWINDAPGSGDVEIMVDESLDTAVGIRDIMSRQAVNVPSTHDLSMNLPVDGILTGDTLTIAYTGFDTDFAASPTIIIGCGGGTATASVSGRTLTVTGGATPCTGTLFVYGFSGTNPTSPGSYRFDFGGTADVHGFFAEPIVDSDQVDVSAAVMPSISFDIDLQAASDALPDASESGTPYVIDLGTISTADSRVSGTTDGLAYIMLDLSSNASAGTVITVKNLHGANGLVSDSVPGDDINSSDGPSGAGIENYGLCSVGTEQAAGGPIAPIIGPFSSACAGDTQGNTILGFTGSPQTIYSSPGPVAFARMMMALQASISGATPAHNDYADVLTFIATGTF